MAGAKVTVEYLSDTYSGCETCGTSYAEGFRVSVDGKEFFTLEPLADCVGGQSFTLEDAMVRLLREWGHELEFK